MDNGTLARRPVPPTGVHKFAKRLSETAERLNLGVHPVDLVLRDGSHGGPAPPITGREGFGARTFCSFVDSH